MPHLLKVQLGWQSLHSQAGVPGVAGKKTATFSASFELVSAVLELD